MAQFHSRIPTLAALTRRVAAALVVHCPFCHQGLHADTDSGEEFSCHHCGAMVDVIDDDLTMVSRAPHADVFYVATSEIRLGSTLS
jgi:hypothetical protein